jgi:tRNA threonylcarbamoyl adenosine modification protein YjeE
VRGLARGLGCDAAAVRSPSFTLLQQYAGRRTLNHFDVYFTKAIADLERSGLDEALAAGQVAAVEWGERFAAGLPADRLEIRFDHVSPEVRRIRFLPGGPAAARWLARAGLAPGRE